METSLTVLAVVASVLGLVLPGVAAISALCPNRALQWRWITGAAAGLAAAVYASFLLSYINIFLFAPVWVLLGAVCFWIWWRQRRRHANRHASLVARPSAIGWMLLITLALGAVLRVGTVAEREVPRGWDASFHSILTQKILLTHRMITDWQPFEAITLNYPLGSHTLIAGLSAAMALPPHRVFNVLLPLLCVLLTGEVYALAAAASHRHGLGLLASVAFGFLALLGSIDIVRWGGMPNTLGMLFLLCFLRLLIEHGFTGRRRLMMVLVAAIILTHHHVMVTACIVMACVMAWTAVHRQWRMVATILLTGTGGSILAAAHLIPYLRKAGTLASTAVLSYEAQPPFWHWLPAVGWVFSFLVVAGVILHVGKQLARRHVAGDTRIHWIVPAVTLILVLLYVAAGIVYPVVQEAHGHPALGAFTPSRFLTDAVPFAAIFAGYALWAVVGTTAWRPRLWHMTALGIAGTLTLLPEWGSMFDEDYPIGLVQAYRWINGNTPPQTIVATTDAWGPYLSWRKTLKTPIPTSEAQGFANDERLLASYLDLVCSGRILPVSSDLTVVRVCLPGEATGGRVLHRDEEGYAVEQLWPR